MKPLGVIVTDNDVQLVSSDIIKPELKASLLKDAEREAVAHLKIRAVTRQRMDGLRVDHIAPEDESKLPSDLRNELLKRDSRNALVALNLMLEKFDSAQENTPDFEDLPEKGLYINRLQAILDVIDSDDKVRERMENAAKGISGGWIHTLRHCLNTKKFDQYYLHNIGKLVRAFMLAFDLSTDTKFETAYVSREIQKN